jgi:hypothetical protein
MRKSWLFIIAFVTLGFLAGTVGAGAVPISGKHGRGEIAATCASVGGTFIGGGWVATTGVQTVVATGKLAQFFATKRAVAKVRAPVAVNGANVEDLSWC